MNLSYLLAVAALSLTLLALSFSSCFLLLIDFTGISNLLLSPLRVSYISYAISSLGEFLKMSQFLLGNALVAHQSHHLQLHL